MLKSRHIPIPDAAHRRGAGWVGLTKHCMLLRCFSLDLGKLKHLSRSSTIEYSCTLAMYVPAVSWNLLLWRTNLYVGM